MENSSILTIIDKLLSEKVDFDIRISVKEGKEEITVSKGNSTEKYNTKEEKLEYVIDKLLEDLRMAENLCGYEYIKESLKILYDDPSVKRGLVKGLYKAIADQLGSTPTGVERGIRLSIHRAFKEPSETALNMFKHILIDGAVIPNNGEFFAVAHKVVCQRMNKAN